VTKRKGQSIGKGVRRKGNKLEGYVRVRGVLYRQSFDPGTPLATIAAWRTATKREHFGGGSRSATATSLAEDIANYERLIVAKPTRAQILAHLHQWASALGRDRSRHSVTTADINTVIQQWLLCAPPRQTDRGRPVRARGLDPQTIRKYRNSLRTFYAVLNAGLELRNPVQDAQNFAPGPPEVRGTDYATVARLLDAMPDYYYVTHGQTTAFSKLRAAVVAYTGIPPGLLGQLTPADCRLTDTPPTVRVPKRHKGEGVEARRLKLTTQGAAALAALIRAGACGPFAVGPVNVSVKRAARRIGLAHFTLYDLRHSFGAQMYRVTGDQATVARLMLHAEGSVMTARYTKAAHGEVDAAAIAGFTATTPGFTPAPVLVVPSVSKLPRVAKRAASRPGY
jgi:integrase